MSLLKFQLWKNKSVQIMDVYLGKNKTNRVKYSISVTVGMVKLCVVYNAGTYSVGCVTLMCTPCDMLPSSMLFIIFQTFGFSLFCKCVNNFSFLFKFIIVYL
jgi:hypothetical protein